MIRPLAAVLLFALPAAAQLPNPAELQEPSEFPEHGVSFAAPEGSVVTATKENDGRVVISASRVVRVGEEEVALGIQVEVLDRLDMESWKALLRWQAATSGCEVKEVEAPKREGPASWRVDVVGRVVTHVLGVDGGDRVVAVRWSMTPGMDGELSALVEACIASVKVESRAAPRVAREPTETWAPEDSGVELKHPKGWRVQDAGKTRALGNPTDRYETLAFGIMPGTIAGRKEVLEQLRKDEPGRIVAAEDRGAGFLGVTRSSRDGFETWDATWFVEHRGALVFVLLSTRAEKKDQGEELLEAVRKSLKLD